MTSVSSPNARVLDAAMQHMEENPVQFFEDAQRVRETYERNMTPISITTSATQNIAKLDFGAFTPEMILYVAKKRMNDIDGQVKDAMAELEHSQHETRKLSHQLQGLRALQKHATAHGQDEHIRLDGVGPTSHEGEEIVNHMIVDGERLTIREVIEKFDLESILTLKSQTNVEDGVIDTFDMVNTNEFQEAVDLLEEKQRDLNTGNELRMVKLQSLMQQRTQILTLATNLLQKLDEGSQAIARNIG